MVPGVHQSTSLEKNIDNLLGGSFDRHIRLAKILDIYFNLFEKIKDSLKYLSDLSFYSSVYSNESNI